MEKKRKKFVFAEEKLGKWEKSLGASDKAFQSAAEDLNRIMLEHENQKKQQAEYAKKSQEIRKSAILFPDRRGKQNVIFAIVTSCTDLFL